MSVPTPMMLLQLGNTQGVPWLAIARHASACILYMIALVQWPGYMVSEWAGEDRAFAYNLTSLMFTLAFWCACLYHYLVSAGRVEVDWSSGRVRAKGWIVRTSRRAHRVLLSLALAISAMTIIQSTTTAMVITHFYIKEDEPHAKEHAILILLKVNQTLAFFMFVYVLGRVVFEPVSIRKPRRGRPAPGSELGHQEETAMKPLSLPEEAEACHICVERWANRQMGCGHLICCCCLVEIWKVEGNLRARCPFCRVNVSSVKQIRIADGGEVPIVECCGRTVSEAASTTGDEATTREGSQHEIQV